MEEEKQRKKGSRYQASSIQLKDGTGPVTKMCSMGDVLEIYKIDRRFKILSPETIDPDEYDPNAPWIVKGISHYGSGNQIVARVFLQSYRAIRETHLEKTVDKQKIFSELRKCRDYILECDQISKEIDKEVENIVNKIEETGLDYDEKRNIISSFPQVEQLDSKTTTFLSSSKRCAQSIANIFNYFFIQLTGVHISIKS